MRLHEFAPSIVKPELRSASVECLERMSARAQIMVTDKSISNAIQFVFIPIRLEFFFDRLTVTVQSD